MEIAAKIPMMTMTISSSTIVKPCCLYGSLSILHISYPPDRLSQALGSQTCQPCNKFVTVVTNLLLFFILVDDGKPIKTRNPRILYQNLEHILCSITVYMTDARKAEAVRLCQEGHSIDEVSRILKAAKSSVGIWTRSVVLSDRKRFALSARSHTPEVIEKRRLSRLSSEKAIYIFTRTSTIPWLSNIGQKFQVYLSLISIKRTENRILLAKGFAKHFPTEFLISMSQM